MPDIFIINEKIHIREICMDDTSMVVKWRHNPRVYNNFLYRGPFTEEIHRNWMETKVASGEVRQFIIEASYGGETSLRPVGSIYFRDVDEVNHTAEYGIFIGEDEAAGCGIGSLVARWAVEYARDVMKLKRLDLRVLADNEIALKSYMKAGFSVCEKTPDYMDGRDLLFMKIDF